jgi:hypothetical protein
MSDSLTALASENLNPSLRSLLEDVQRGHIRVPRFQRPFVWTDDQRLELLQSVRDNMPIGSLLVWRTIKFKLASFPTVGPHIIPPIVDIAPATGWQYLLDGHQRVSTLLGLLLPPVPMTSTQLPSDEDVIDWDIQYDLMDQDFVFARKARKKTTTRPLLPLWTLFDGRLVNKHMRDMRRQGVKESWTDADLDAWETRADQLSYRFQQCRIPIVVMVTDDLNLAAKTFQRINSLGTPMGEAHLVAALTWRAEFDLRERLDDLREEFPPGWRKIDEGLFLQVCKGLTGLDMTKAGQTELVKKLTEDQKLLERAGTGLKRAVKLLSDSAGVVQQELLPYAFQVVFLAVELASKEPDDLMRHAFIAWFWRTSWSEVFGSASYRQVRSEQEFLHNATKSIAEVPWVRAQAFPDRFDFRSARVRLLMLRLAARPGLLDAAGQPADGRALLATYGREALVRLFPVPRGASPTLKRLLQGGGNRFLVDPTKDAVLRERLRNGPDLTTEALASHFVDAEGLTALRAGDLETFVQRRAKALETWDLAEWDAERPTTADTESVMSFPVRVRLTKIKYLAELNRQLMLHPDNKNHAQLKSIPTNISDGVIGFESTGQISPNLVFAVVNKVGADFELFDSE